MHVARFPTPESFLQAAEAFLLESEVENHVMLGLRDSVKMFGEDAYLAAVFDGGRVVACGVRTPPYRAVITSASPDVLDYLVTDMADRYPDLPEVFGREPAVTHFAELWARRTRVPSTRGKQQRLFVTHHAPEWVSWPHGGLRLAEDRDLPILVAWTAALIEEALPGDPTDPEQHAARRIATRSVCIWEDGRPVSMAGWAGRTSRGVRVNYVYTPPEHRRNGYATAAVARLTQQRLDEGLAFCCLYTDLENPTSNSIYQKIGYRPVCDLSNYVLNSRKADTVR